MTIPNMQQSGSAPPGYVQMPGGYAEAIQQQQPQQVPVPQQMMQQQPQQMALPPQMQQQMQQLNGAPSPLSQMAPVPFQPRQQPQPQQQQQQQFPPQQQFAPQQQQQPMVLTGPGVPTELQGRTLSEAIAIYNGMRQTHLQQMAAPQQQAPAPVPQQQQQAPPANGQNAPAFDWRNPAASVAAVVRQEMQDTLVPMLAPIAQQNAISGIQNARAQAAAVIGVQNWTAMEPEILQALNGADPRALANPQTWQLAAQVVAGKHALQGRQQQVQQPQAPGMYPAQAVQNGQNPLPNLNGFFSEQPNQGGPIGGAFQLSQSQRMAANAMGIPETEYAAWAVGVGRNG